MISKKKLQKQIDELKTQLTIQKQIVNKIINKL